MCLPNLLYQQVAQAAWRIENTHLIKENRRASLKYKDTINTKPKSKTEITRLRIISWERSSFNKVSLFFGSSPPIT